MVDRNLLCNEASCGMPVSAFGFNRTGSKLYVCRGHVTVLLDKRISIFDIESESFVQSISDGPEYERRRGLKEQGLGTLGALETRCDADLEEAERNLQKAEETLIEVLRESLKAVKFRLQRRQEEIKRLLNQAKMNFERLTQDRDFELSATDLAMIKAVQDVPLFRLFLEDCSSSITQVVTSSGYLLPLEDSLGAVTERDATARRLEDFAKDLSKRGKSDVALEAAVYAALLANTEVSHIYQSAAIQHRQKSAEDMACLLPGEVPEQDLQAFMTACVSTGSAERRAGNYEAALPQLERCWALVHSRRQETPELCLEFGLVLSHYASRRTQAHAVLKRGLDLQLASDPEAEMGLQLNNALAETYHQAGLWEETKSECQRMLDSWSASPHALQLLRAYFLLADSRWYLEKIEKGSGEMEAWAGSLRAEGTLTQWLERFVKADQARKGENIELTISQEIEANSYIAACATRWQALSHKIHRRLDSAETSYRSASDLYQAHYSETLDFAICRASLGSLYEELKRPEQAEKEYKAAEELYSSHYPDTIYYASCLFSLGLLCASQKLPLSQVEDYYQRASQIYSAHYPQALGFATCLGTLGFLYFNELTNTHKAEQHFVAACNIYASRNSKSLNYAICLFNLASLYESNGQKKEARERYQQSLDLYTANNDQDRMKKCRIALKRL